MKSSRVWFRNVLLAAAGVVTAFAPQEVSAQPTSHADTIRMSLRWEIAPDKSPVADSLGQLSGIVVDKFGNSYVSDFSANTIWVFDRNGKSAGKIGRKGKGPGEFDHPTGLGISPKGRLFVRDITRVTRFTIDNKINRFGTYETVSAAPALADYTSTRPTKFDSAGRYFFPSFNAIPKSPKDPSGRYLVYNEAGTLTDSVVVPGFANAPMSTAWIPTGPNGGRMVNGLNYPPFTPLPTWDITAQSTILVGDGLSYSLEERDANGRVLHRYQRTIPADGVPAKQRSDSVRALKIRVDSLKVPYARVTGMPASVPALQLPTTFPAFMAAYSADDGKVWVRRWPVGGGPRTIFDVFSNDGKFINVVVLPRELTIDPRPTFSLDQINGIAIDAETGAYVVLSFGRAATR